MRVTVVCTSASMATFNLLVCRMIACRAASWAPMAWSVALAEEASESSRLVDTAAKDIKSSHTLVTNIPCFSHIREALPRWAVSVTSFYSHIEVLHNSTSDGNADALSRIDGSIQVMTSISSCSCWASLAVTSSAGRSFRASMTTGGSSLAWPSSWCSQSLHSTGGGGVYIKWQ